MTQYMAIATSAFTYRMDEEASTPERWMTYVDWMRSLPDGDAIISFNYDRVVEIVRDREKREISLVKLHGSVPEAKALEGLVKQGRPVDSIKVPGPLKIADLDSQVWKDAAEHLRTATRLVVVGYSFPESDPFGRNFILKHCEARWVIAVLGRDKCTDGPRVAQMFKRMGIDSEDSGQYAQEYLSEGTAKLDKSGRFVHRPKSIDRPRT
jgi:hypothetical protein